MILNYLTRRLVKTVHQQSLFPSRKLQLTVCNSMRYCGFIFKYSKILQKQKLPVNARNMYMCKHLLKNKNEKSEETGEKGGNANNTNDRAKEKDKVTLESVKESILEKHNPIKKLTEILINVEENPEVKKIQMKRKSVDLEEKSLKRNFITPVKAMSDFLLKPSDLEPLPKTKRRSPYEFKQPITVYWRKDVEAKALQVWGSKENLQQELRKMEIERKNYQQDIVNVKKRLRESRRKMSRSIDAGLKSSSGRVILLEITSNATNCLLKFFAYLYTGSHSMFAESIHSLADTINQLILAFGIHKSTQIADKLHPYGYFNMKYLTALISGVGILCVGPGLSFYNGINGILDPQPAEDYFWAYCVLCSALLTDSITCSVALNTLKRGAKEKSMSVKEYILKGKDPSVNVVLLEDMASISGSIVAGTCITLSSITNNPVPDAVGSLVIGCILGIVASFIIYTNGTALVGRSICEEKISRIHTEMESDIMIRAIHDVKAIDMGSSLVRYKAELDFDGRNLTIAYLEKQDLKKLLEDIKKLENIDMLEEFMSKHGENIVDMIGGEIDRIEMELRKKHPEVRHCDLELL